MKKAIPSFLQWSLVLAVVLTATLVIKLLQGGYFNRFELILNHHKVWIDFLIGVGTILAVGVALLLARWGDSIKNKPKISINATHIVITSQNYQNGGKLQIYRCVLKNDGQAPIKNIRCVLENIEEGTINNFKQRKNFISVPLNWTHFGMSREIAIKEEAYIDVVQIYFGDQIEHFFRICWAQGLGFPDEPSISRLSFDNDYILYLVFYSEKLIGKVKIKLKHDLSATII